MNHMTLAAFRQLPSPAGRDGVEAFVEPAPVETDAASLRDYWRVIRKHPWLIAACCFGAIFATALVLFMVTPIYTAETTLLIERQTPQVLNIQEVVSEPLMANESDFYKTQYEILKSRTLAAWTIKEQGLETNSLFTGEGENESVVAKWRDKAKGWLNRQWWASRFFPPPPAVQAEDALGVKPAIIEAYLGMLEIIPVQRTRLVKLAFNTRDPALSASLANAHALAYIRHGLGLRTQTNEDAEQFLEGKLAELKGRVERSEEALNRYRRDKKMISLGDKENIVIDRLADLNKRLTEAETNRIALEAQVRLIRRRDYDSLPAVMNSGLIQNLKEQLGHLAGC